MQEKNTHEIEARGDKSYMEQFALRRNFSIPNLLSVFRLLLIPFFMLAYFHGQVTKVIMLVAVSALTDMLDGWIARRFNQITTLGKVLDPIADKLTQIALAICICASFPVVIPLVAILLVKELCMLYWGARLIKRGKPPFSACWWGKLSTVLFYAGALVIITFEDDLGQMGVMIVCTIIIISLIYSMVRYGWEFSRRL